MADTLVIGRALAPGVGSISKLTTELSSLQLNTTASTLTPGTVLSGVIRNPGVAAVSKLTTELTSLQLNTTLAGLYPSTKVLGTMERPGVGSVQRLSTFIVTSNDPVVLTTGSVATVTQNWTLGL